ncbi:MAG: Dyp-type peroxidase [bacterium]
MTTELDLADIQGNIIRAYGRFGFPKARFFFLRIDDGEMGRAFVGTVTKRVTTSVRWGPPPKGVIPRPKAPINIAFTYNGLKALGLPRASLVGFPQEFIMGMKERKAILGDDGLSDPVYWDKVWEKHEDVHVAMSINGQSIEDVEDAYQWVKSRIDGSERGVVLLTGHRGADGAEDLPFQDASVLYDESGNIIAKEHFGYTDGIGDPVFEGQITDEYRVVGRGKLTREGGWARLETGEFLLGHPDEAHEYPRAPAPTLLSSNGTFMVYRKLHQNVASFERLLDAHADSFPGGRELLAAKFSGRWRDNGAPLVHTPDAASKAAWDQRFAAADERTRDKMLADFRFDLMGDKCPIGAHIRRINPRGSLEFGQDGAYDTPGALDDRRRILRRGLPYGVVRDRSRDDGDHGVIFMALNTSIERQFEFVQQQWINYANDSKEGNDKDVLLGNHGDPNGGCPSKMVIHVDPKSSGQPPYFVNQIPRLVETRGGDYFFIPSMTALRMIAKGRVDPT